jgi:16S rRNA (guanine527-N7)-methyltransferase
MESYNVPHGTIEKYIELLVSWNKKVNLISPNAKNELIERHILDSLQLLNYIDNDDIVFDIGSGAGFPGLMLSYGGIKNVNLIESNSKKASFLTVSATLSKNKIKIYNQNVKSIEPTTCDIITARAIAPLNEIFELSSHLVTPNTKYFLLKGINITSEIKKALDKWNFEYIIHKSKTSSEGCVLEVQQLRLK